MQSVDTSDVPVAVAAVRDFVNTTDRETGVDDLATPAALARFLSDRGLVPRSARASTAHLDTAQRLRAGLRSALELNHEGRRAALPELARSLGDQPVALTWTSSGPVLTTTASGVSGGLARLAIAAHEAAVEGSWWRLKVCAWEECEWAYYDRSKNRSRSWCEYGCGNKVKTRAYRARQAGSGR